MRIWNESWRSLTSSICDSIDFLMKTDDVNNFKKHFSRNIWMDESMIRKDQNIKYRMYRKIIVVIIICEQSWMYRGRVKWYLSIQFNWLNSRNSQNIRKMPGKSLARDGRISDARSVAIRENIEWRKETISTNWISLCIEKILKMKWRENKKAKKRKKSRFSRKIRKKRGWKKSILF